MTTACGISTFSRRMYCQQRPSQSSSITVRRHPQLHAVEQAEVPGDLRAVDGRGDPRFLVAGPAAVDDPVLQFAKVRIARPCRAIAHADGVEVPVEGDHRVAAADAPEQVAEAIHLDLVEPEHGHLGACALDDGALVGALRGDRDHVAQEVNHVGRVTLGEVRDSVTHGIGHGRDLLECRRYRVIGGNLATEWVRPQDGHPTSTRVHAAHAADAVTGRLRHCRRQRSA